MSSCGPLPRNATRFATPVATGRTITRASFARSDIALCHCSDLPATSLARCRSDDGRPSPDSALRRRPSVCVVARLHRSPTLVALQRHVVDHVGDVSDRDAVHWQWLGRQWHWRCDLSVNIQGLQADRSRLRRRCDRHRDHVRPIALTQGLTGQCRAHSRLARALQSTSAAVPHAADAGGAAGRRTARRRLGSADVHPVAARGAAGGQRRLRAVVSSRRRQRTCGTAGRAVIALATLIPSALPLPSAFLARRPAPSRRPRPPSDRSLHLRRASLERAGAAIV